MFCSLLTSTVPNAVGIAGSFAGSVGFMGSVGMFYVGLGLVNVFWPTLRRQFPGLGKDNQQKMPEPQMLQVHTTTGLKE